MGLQACVCVETLVVRRVCAVCWCGWHVRLGCAAGGVLCGRLAWLVCAAGGESGGACAMLDGIAGMCIGKWDCVHVREGKPDFRCTHTDATRSPIVHLLDSLLSFADILDSLNVKKNY